MILHQLFRPVFGYLSIKHPTKVIVDWLLPCILVGISLIFVWAFRGKINIFGAGGTISLILGYVQNLPGFYIAALAAIATFARQDIDVLMPGNPPPKIKTSDNRGIVNLVELTRRRFLCLLFAYLTAECIFLTLISVLFMSIAPAVKDMLKFEVLNSVVFYLAISIYLLTLFQLLITTFWGLYYLGERIHQVDT